MTNVSHLATGALLCDWLVAGRCAEASWMPIRGLLATKQTLKTVCTVIKAKMVAVCTVIKTKLVVFFLFSSSAADDKICLDPQFTCNSGLPRFPKAFWWQMVSSCGQD